MTMRTTARQRDLVERLVTGALAGLIGGVVLGVLMQVMGMIEMIAMLVGSSMMGHLIFGAVTGAAYAAGRRPAH